MKITDVHLNRETEIRFTVEHQGVTRVRWIFHAPGDSPLVIAQMITANVEHFVNLVENGGIEPYNTEEHIAGIERDARRYGCD